MEKPDDYHRLKRFIFGFLAIYFVVGLSTNVLLPRRGKDFIPFYSWFLFSHVPNPHNQVQYAVRILEYNGRRLDPPVFTTEAYGIVDDPKSSKLRELIRHFGHSVVAKHVGESERLRRILEQIYLPGSMRYELVTVTYSPAERLITGKLKKVRQLGEYVKVAS